MRKTYSQVNIKQLRLYSLGPERVAETLRAHTVPEAQNIQLVAHTSSPCPMEAKAGGL